MSDTLSNTLPVSSALVPEPSLPLRKTSYKTTSIETKHAAVPVDSSAIKSESENSFFETKNESDDLYRSCVDFSVENGLNASSSNITATSSQQDYVSAMGEDLSIGNWEYQLPAPPSAFRDSHLPICDDYDTVTLGSVEAFKEPSVSPITELTNTTDVGSNKNSKSTKNLLTDVGVVNCNRKASKEKMDLVSEKKEIDIKQTASESIAVEYALPASQKPETDSDLRKEIILELENKIETGTLVQTVNKDFDRRNMDSLSAPKLAPVDNTLSNFTITTYTRQKSLDIFEEFEESSDCARNLEERFIKTFATLSRNNAGNNACNYDKKAATRDTDLINLSHNGKMASNKSEGPNMNNIDCGKTASKIRDRNDALQPYKWQSFNVTNDKINIQRSKSYISMSNHIKYQKEAQGVNGRKHEPQIEPEITDMQKVTSITDLNTLRNNEKFSQWRDNILKNQKEPTKEKQLQSLQVIWNYRIMIVG